MAERCAHVTARRQKGDETKKRRYVHVYNRNREGEPCAGRAQQQQHPSESDPDADTLLPACVWPALSNLDGTNKQTKSFRRMAETGPATYCYVRRITGSSRRQAKRPRRHARAVASPRGCAEKTTSCCGRHITSRLRTPAPRSTRSNPRRPQPRPPPDPARDPGLEATVLMTQPGLR